MNRDDFKELAHQRLEDARVLLENERYSAAYYLSGYAVECALKWTRPKAYGLFEAISNTEHGVLQWISRHW